MKGTPIHRGAEKNIAEFSMNFVAGRLAGFEKDIMICLRPAKLKIGSRVTHAYFPALAACCGILEYFTALYRGDIRSHGWDRVADWAGIYLPQPEYERERIRILFNVFRHPVAHRGIASGVWTDQDQGPGNGRRFTWRVLADAKHPSVDIRIERGVLRKDSPWLCQYTHRVHIHLKGLSVDIRNAAKKYRDDLACSPELQAKFRNCMEQLYPD
jgi:hypothetical protein